jgi:hypothetical protein
MNDSRLEKMRDLVVIAVTRVREQHARLSALSADVLALQAAVRDIPLMNNFRKNKRVLKAVHTDLAIPDSDDALNAVIQQLKDLKF